MIIQLGVVKMRYYLFLVIFLVSFVGAVTFDSSVVLNTSSSNSSVTFSVSVNITNITVESSYVYLYNVSFVNASGFYDCGDINHSDENSVLDSADFSCNTTEVEGSIEEEVSTSVSFSGGSTYYPSLDDLELGYTRNVKKGLRLRVFVDGDAHYVKVQDIEGEKVLVSVSSDVQEKWLLIGEEWFVEVTNDSIYDVYIRVNSISGLYANITLKRIEEVIDIIGDKKSLVDRDIENSEDTESIEYFMGYGKWIIIGASGVLLLAILFLIILEIKKPLWKKRSRKNQRFIRRYRRR